MLAILALGVAGAPTSSEGLVKSATYSIFYDPASGGYASVVLGLEASGPTLFDIQLFRPSANFSSRVVNVTFSNPSAVVIPPAYNEANCSISFVVNASTSLTIYLVLTGLLEELVPGAYAGLLDLTMFANSSVTATITLPGSYRVIVNRLDAPGSSSAVALSGNTTIVTLSSPGLYYLVFIAQYTAPSTESRTGQGWPLPLAIVLALGLAALALAAALAARRFLKARKIELETVAGRAIETDEVAREVVLALGDAGEGGLRQSEVVDLIKRPKSSVSRRVKRLVDEGYVEVVRSGKHNILRLTGKGRELYKRLKEGKRG